MIRVIKGIVYSVLAVIAFLFAMLVIYVLLWLTTCLLNEFGIPVSLVPYDLRELLQIFEQ